MVRGKFFKNGLGSKRLIPYLLITALVFSSFGQFFSLSTVAAATAMPVMNPGGVPDYFGTIGNYANSPLPELDTAGNIIKGTGIRKFVDTLPGLGIANANNLGQYLPVAVPDTTTYPGSDYYEINLVEYREQVHSDLPATRFRGYVQVNTTDPAISKPNYLGPIIIAHKDVPVRIKFTNKLPIGSGGNLFLPVDTTVMGSGMGPIGMEMGSGMTAADMPMYTQNRATLHLHGGVTPWISDGTPHQWITPADENTPYPKGVSVQNVPDMPDPGPGAQTFFYTNQQSARLMFYHDHTYGLTRLNIYAGEVAGYILRDKTEEDLIARGVIPSAEIPLIIQDKTFVPKDDQLVKQDPTWDKVKWGEYGDLWFPHVYMPNQNPYDDSGSNPVGRWDYGPWFWPPYTGLQYGPVANPLFGTDPGEPPMNPGVPNVSVVPEAFLDTPMVNGTAYPTLTVEPKPYRFRILNACNDRFLNLQLYKAKSNSPMWDANGNLLDANAGEVNMVSAVKTTGFPATWPTDGREGGVPDPTAIGPSFLQFGSEGGFLPELAEINSQPINYEYNRRSITVLNVAEKALFMGSAERADVVIDFSKYAGQTLILYNDAPAPVPAFDPRYDYYTGNPDLTATGGAPSTLPGYGPNMRTIMQIKVAASTPQGYKLDLGITNSGSGYTAPAVAISGGQGPQATAIASGVLDNIQVISAGAGYTVAPTVTISGGSPTINATAKASLKIESIALTNGGSGYTSVPAVTITDASGAGIGATAVATIDPVQKVVTAITITNPGSGYLKPVLKIIGGGTTKAALAVITGAVDAIKISNPGDGYIIAPTITLTTGTLPAMANATIKLTKLTLINASFGYSAAPTITITDSVGTGVGATGVANLAEPKFMLTKNLPAAFKESQNPLIIPEGVYARIQETKLTFKPTATSTAVTVPMEPKAIQELFTLDYGRMNATLGVELPNTSATIQTTIPLGYIDPVTEVMDSSVIPIAGTVSTGTQIWKITHNGVDTHGIHFHLFDVQLLNRVGWDGAIKPPDANERGWKDTVKMNPLEDCIIAIRPIAPKINFGVPDSIRALDPTMPIGSTAGFTQIDPKTGNPKVVANEIVNFGWEYMWHCHILGHEENDMMRPIILNVARSMPTATVLSATRELAPVKLSWIDGTPANSPASMGNPANEIGYRIERAPVVNGKIGTYVQIGTALANAIVYQDNSANPGTGYSYRVIAYNVVGKTLSNVVNVNAVVETPTNLTAAVQTGPKVSLTWTDNATNETGFVVERAENGGAFIVIANPPANKNTGTVSYTDSTVHAGISYEYRVIAVKAIGQSDYSNTVSIGVLMTLAAPTNFNATLQAGPKVSLTWNDNANNETGFMIERATNAGNFEVIANPGPKNGMGNMSYTDTKAAFGNSYLYRVRAVKGTILSAYPNPIAIDIASLPAAPSGMMAMATRSGQSATVMLNWTDNANNETSFTLQRATNSSFMNGLNTSTLAANTVTVQQNGLQRRTTYWYRIQANNSSGASAWSMVTSVTTP
ncbi:MAG: hypothetical protein WCI30_08645 [Clostridia bacterium]